MRVVEVRQFGGPEVLEPAHRPDPVPGPGEALVEVAAADVMFLDTQIRAGWGKEYFQVDPPYVPGNGVAGRVTAVGDGVEPGWVGAEVITETGRRDPDTGLSVAPTDGYAERAVVPAAGLVRRPDGLGTREALSLLHDGPTAMELADTAGFAPGDWVLVAAATGGAGSLLVQIARAAGAHVIGAARGQRKLSLARRLGAEAVVDYTEPGWVERVRAIAGDGGPRVVLDGAGGTTGDAAFGSVADGGHFISYGGSSGSFAEPDAQDAERRGVEVTGLFDLRITRAAVKDRLLERALDLAAAGRLRPTIGQTFPLEQAKDAHAALAARETLGKTLLLT